MKDVDIIAEGLIARTAATKLLGRCRETVQASMIKHVSEFVDNNEKRHNEFIRKLRHEHGEDIRSQASLHHFQDVQAT